jgi:hypothetical protein
VSDVTLKKGTEIVPESGHFGNQNPAQKRFYFNGNDRLC